MSEIIQFFPVSQMIDTPEGKIISTKGFLPAKAILKKQFLDHFLVEFPFRSRVVIAVMVKYVRVKLAGESASTIIFQIGPQPVVVPELNRTDLKGVTLSFVEADWLDLKVLEQKNTEKKRIESWGLPEYSFCDPYLMSAVRALFEIGKKFWKPLLLSPNAEKLIPISMDIPSLAKALKIPSARLRKNSEKNFERDLQIIRAYLYEVGYAKKHNLPADSLLDAILASIRQAGVDAYADTESLRQRIIRLKLMGIRESLEN